jgi:hypothetical protein
MLIPGILLVIIVALGLPGPASFAQGGPPKPSDETLALIQNTILPPRDRIDLAKRLLGVTVIPEPPAEPAAEYEVGDVVTFWADNLDEDFEFQVEAELVYETEHIYMFVEVGQEVDRQAVQQSAETFENIIRPRVHEVFGTEWFPGIDGDPHLYILHARNLGSWVAAYYGSESQYPTEAVPTSNEHEMFYVNLDNMAWSVGTPYYEGVLAHEFQHMVHWHVDSNEDTWMNEGLSELSAMIAGYGSSGFATDFLLTPDLQLNNWPEEDNRGTHYGAAFMFLAYFYERYGEEATTTLVSDPANGLESVQNALEAISATDPATGEPVDRVDLFGDWLVTNLLQDPSVGDGRYAYTFSEMAGLPQAAITERMSVTPTPVADEAPQWGPTYLQLAGGPEATTYRFSFDGSETVSIVPVNAYSGQYMWWSNRGDDSDSRLTRTFDLTGVSSATLNFWTWYYIEDLWDYGYVMISTDGGTTWTALETSRTTTEDPHSNAYGPGYTGQSGDGVQESVDLTRYAGQEIQVRFEYITDDAVTQPGMIVDDVTIPEIGYEDDFETGDGGWVSEGWIRTNNVLPQEFLVQLVQPGNSDAPVTRLLGPDDAPQGEWEITVGGDLGDAVIVVAGLAPVTTEPARYQYSLSEVP